MMTTDKVRTVRGGLARLAYRVLVATAGVFLAVALGRSQQRLSPSALRDHPHIAYATTPPRDAVARLAELARHGAQTFQFDARHGYLESALAALDISADSQILVFSKTSFQASKIGPRTPRALYFNDSVAVGWVNGGDVLEFAAQDPAQGTIFYTLEQTPAGQVAFQRNAACVQCHTSEGTLDVPGMFVGSSYPDKSGVPLFTPFFSTDHRTPFDARWGGWYVTGQHQGRHLGNGVATDLADVATFATTHAIGNLQLSERFDAAAYLEPTSDIVALLVLEHQMRMSNLMTRLGWEFRVGSAETPTAIERAVAELVDYLLFVDEAELPGPIIGSSTFAKTFASRASRDRRGRSLKDLDLRDRLFRYPCSYLIYSAQFTALPEALRQRIYVRMYDILSGRDAAPKYARLSSADRGAVIEILIDTKPDLPAYFRDALRAASE